MLPRFLLLAGTALAANSMARADTLNWEPAPRADDFVNSIGVCTHFTYGDTPYGKIYDVVKQRLAQSGIRNVRDGYSARTPELWKDLGIRTSVISEPQLGDLDKQRARWDALPGALGMIEGPNEPNLFWKRFNQTYKGQGWPDGVKAWQNDLYAAVRADPQLNAVRVCSPTPIFEGPREAAPLTSFDYLALHPYAGGNMPSMACQWDGPATRAAILLLGHDNDLKPLVATESGYHNSAGSDAVIAGNQPGISETAGGRYFPRHFTEFWNAGFARTYVYEFINEWNKPNDPESNFGLLRFDGTPKPAFIALSNLIALENESTWNAAALQWSRPGAPERALRLAIDGPPTVHHCVLAHADGTFDILLWNEVPSFDLKTHSDLNPAPVPVTVRLGTAAAAALYQPLTGTTVHRQWAKSTSISLAVPDEVLVLRLPPSKTNASAPATPANLAASVGPTSASLRWDSAGHAPAAFIVKRLGRYLATVPAGAHGAGAFTDTGLTPGLGYPYSVSAVNGAGLVSAAATVIARTPNLRPDLIVKSLFWTPTHPKPGDEVQFSATIANIGVASTPAVTHGVAFSIDGKTVNWSDTSHDPLAPGGTRTLTANNGPHGKGTWTCADGTFQVAATVDDINRIDESNKANNTLKAVLSTGKGCDLIVTGVRVEGDAVAGQRVMLIGTVKNIGTMPTPQGILISCTFIGTDSNGARVNAGYGAVTQVLGAGESVDIRLQQPWIPPVAGTIQMTGIVDDINRIQETDETNNTSAPVAIVVK